MDEYTDNLYIITCNDSTMRLMVIREFAVITYIRLSRSLQFPLHVISYSFRFARMHMCYYEMHIKKCTS